MSTENRYNIPAQFTLLDATELPEINATMLQLRHNATGARLVHLDRDDSNNLFAVAFKTPPPDSTGVAHILEHTALCGSKRYPVRDPFFTMLKRSLNTFMNAFTASDWTCYPFSSQNRKDFYNLLGIYLDAAFFPLLRKEDFAQEGHRLEFERMDDPASPLQFKGVVYNEMKGAMSDPASLLARRTTRHLYPDTCYRHNSGGEPENIPDLSWEQLRQFHAEYYHPSNACFFSYGNFPFKDHLRVIEEQVLRHFNARAVNSAVATQPPLARAQMVEEAYPVDTVEECANKTMVHISWLTDDIADSFHILSLTLLAQLLLGNPGAPLYKALLDSGLGSNLTPGSGFHDDYRTTCFAVGLQGCSREAATEVEQLVLTTLEDIATNGFERQRVDAAIHRLELANREVSGDSYPYAISLMFRLLGPWLHCDDPLSPLQLEANLARLRRELDNGDFFAQLIRSRLLNNKHRITLCLYPDHHLGAQMEQQERLRLDTIRAGLSNSEVAEIIARAQQLQAAQERQDDLSSLPTLELEDIRREEDPVASRMVAATAQLRFFPQPTNGLCYFNLLFPCAHLDDELRPYLPMFCTLLTQVGTDKYSYVEMAQRMEATTGGISAGIELLDNIDELDNYRPLVRLRGKALQRNVDKLATLMGEIATVADFSDCDRLGTVIGQMKSSWENSIPASGHSFAARAAAASLTAAARQREEWSGFSQYRLIKQAAKLDGEQLRATADIMQRIAAAVFRRNDVKASFTCEEHGAASGEHALTTLLEQLPVGSGAAAQAVAAAVEQGSYLGVATTTPVSYVTRVFRTVPFTHGDSAALKVLAALLKSSFLHREIREKGGAYGGMATCNSEAGLFAMLSYRDPHLLRTLKVYDEAVAWLRSGAFGQQEIKEALLTVFSALDKPLSPAGRGSNEFANFIQGLTPELRQQFRQRLLAVDKKQLLTVAERYLGTNSASSVAILSNSDALTKAQQELPQLRIEHL